VHGRGRLREGGEVLKPAGRPEPGTGLLASSDGVPNRRGGFGSVRFGCLVAPWAVLVWLQTRWGNDGMSLSLVEEWLHGGLVIWCSGLRSGQGC
jgi:hypothetical protein